MLFKRQTPRPICQHQRRRAESPCPDHCVRSLAALVNSLRPQIAATQVAARGSSRCKEAAAPCDTTRTKAKA